MCVIAGYIGNQQAAPILLDMLKREEGFAGAFYTGIATVHEGRLYHAKVVGDAATLERETDARNLPGTIGIAHGRPAGGGDREWGHPFVDQAEQLAFIANGASGRYDTDLNPAAHALFQANINLRSATPLLPSGVEGRYRTRLPNGHAVHGSEVLCHLLSQTLAERRDTDRPLQEAMAHLFHQWPEEIVAMCVHAKEPDQIAAANHNYPMVIGQDDQGAIHIASMALAFPPSVKWRMRMPPNSSATLHRRKPIDVRPLPNPRYAMAPFPSASTVEQRVVSALRQRPEGLKADEMMALIKPAWPGDALIQKEVVIYELIESLLAEGKVQVENRPVLGMDGKGTVPQFFVKWQYHQPASPTSSTAFRSRQNIAIRSGCPTDLPAITEFTAQAFGPMTMSYLSEQFFGKPLGGRPWQQRIIDNVVSSLQKPDVEWFVAECDGKTVGYASYWYEADRNVAVVGYNAVAPEYQGRGIGTALQQHIIDQLYQTGHEQWQVTTLGHDYPAQRVYEKFGFVEIARSVVYLHKPNSAAPVARRSADSESAREHARPKSL